jgi:hypothetical protein
MKILAAISFGLAVAVSGLLMVLPTYSGWSSESPLFSYGPDRRCMPMKSIRGGRAFACRATFSRV